MSDQPALKILGQELIYPTTWPGAISAIVFCVCAVLIVLTIYVWGNNQSYSHVENLFSTQTRYAPNGEPKDESNRRQIQFWTPSEKTHAGTDSQDLGEENRWETGTTTEKVQQFEERLKQYSSGWRRTEIYGSGRTKAKHGYWWVVTLTDSADTGELVRAYAQFWETKQSIYVEEPRLIGGYKDSADNT